MDRFALRMANLLVGNHEDAAALEATFTGPELEFTTKALVAITGAELPPRVNGETRQTWTSFSVRPGDVLSFDILQQGARAYIAVCGGIDVPVVLGSRATYTLGALGGHEGRRLKGGDRLAIGSTCRQVREGLCLPPTLRSRLDNSAELRVLPGLYWHRLTEAAGQGFFEDEWRVAAESDRVGYRFKGGRPLAFVPRPPPFGAGSDPSNIVDACYPYGSIQVPGGTEPIILHRDAVSGGGYCMVGTVISADMDRIGQLQPHARVRFVKVDMEQALAARHAHDALLSQAREHLRRQW
jgi:biotin-dependent carboxylase-like uncharacterized protein